MSSNCDSEVSMYRIKFVEFVTEAGRCDVTVLTPNWEQAVLIANSACAAGKTEVKVFDTEGGTETEVYAPCRNLVPDAIG